MNILQRLKVTMVAVFTMSSIVLAPVVVSTPVYAAPADEICRGATGNTGCNAPGPNIQQLIQNIINILTFIVGAVAVVFIIIGGFKYVTSNGDQSQITAAKNTILYAVIGLVVTVAAYAVVTFVVTSLTAPPSTS